jgi:hypothetical protein
VVDNAARYGFRPYVKNVGDLFTNKRHVATAYQAVAAGEVSVGLSIGDLIIELSDGSLQLAAAATTPWAPVAARGVIVGFGEIYNAAQGRMEYADYLPGGNAWGTKFARAPQILWVPVEECLWEVDVDDKVTATTEAGYRAFVGENVDHIFVPDVTDSAKPRANGKLDISGHATTDTLFWRIVGISPTSDNRDFSGANVKLLVRANVYQSGPSGV